MRTRLAALAAWPILALIFAVDALTTQVLVIAILLVVPIVLAALTRDRRLTWSVVAAAVLANAGAAALNARAEGRWDATALGDRALVMVALVLVGVLSMALQRRSENIGRLAADASLFARLSEREAVIRDLVAALAHDLRTPVAALGMTLRQAEHGAYGELPESYRGVLRTSVVANDDLQRLAETLLAVARLEADEYSDRPETVDLSRLLRQIAEEFSATAETRGAVLTYIGTEPLHARVDRSGVRRAVGNLVANALQHIPSGGQVTLDLHRRRERAEIVVSDDGFGVDPAVREHLFERNAGQSRPGSGTGLGLYIARRIAERAGGTLRYEDNVPRGSRFIVSLPRVAA